MKYIFTILFVLFFAGCSNTMNTPSSIGHSNSFLEVDVVAQQDLSNDSDVSVALTPNQNDQKSIDTLEQQKPLAIQTIEQTNKNSFGILFASKVILKYSNELINTLNNYAIYKESNISLYTFDGVFETKEALQKQINLIHDANITKVIALLTKESLQDLDFFDDTIYYFPLVHKNEIPFDTQQNLYFGAIDYKQQTIELLATIGEEKFIEFYDDSALGNMLHSYVQNHPNLIYSKPIDDNNRNYKDFIQNNKQLENSVLLLNTPIVKSSILLSQLNAYKKHPKLILSSQLNYTSLIISLTQYEDRKNLFIANSIAYLEPELLEYLDFNAVNVVYRWVNYATIVGFEYLINQDISQFKELKIEQNQIIYPIKFYKISQNSIEIFNK
ncbi:MAG: hypothetical protein IE909_04335 [Campylobacterales bacterium]|nr:hypothetical protein [Campylobacterales bacterium]